jgi:hypothetical protein
MCLVRLRMDMLILFKKLLTKEQLIMQKVKMEKKNVFNMQKQP